MTNPTTDHRDCAQCQSALDQAVALDASFPMTAGAASRVVTSTIEGHTASVRRTPNQEA